MFEQYISFSLQVLSSNLASLFNFKLRYTSNRMRGIYKKGIKEALEVGMSYELCLMSVVSYCEQCLMKRRSGDRAETV